MADQSIRGRFVWHELTTPDEGGAHTFYSKTLGWKAQAWDQDPSYQMLVGPTGPLGGTVADPNGPPQWLAYIGADDVAAVVDQAQRLGGSVVKGLQTMPNGGTYAVLADPQGARFGVYASTAQHGKEAAPKRGEFSWHELATTDYKAAFDFYANLFGWERIAEHDMGPLGVYFIFGAKGVQKGGIFNKPAEMKGPPFWLGYVRVKDVNQTVKKVKGARGALINGPMEVPGGDWIAQFTDPYGAMFAAHAIASDVKTEASAPPREEEQSAAPAAQAPAKPAKPEKAATQPAAQAAPAANKAAKQPAKKKAAVKSTRAPAKKTAKKAAKKSAKKSAKRPAKKAAGKKAAGKKQAAKAGAKKRAAKSAKRPARKAARGGAKAARRKK